MFGCLVVWLFERDNGRLRPRPNIDVRSRSRRRVDDGTFRKSSGLCTGGVFEFAWPDCFLLCCLVMLRLPLVSTAMFLSCAVIPAHSGCGPLFASLPLMPSPRSRFFALVASIAVLIPSSWPSCRACSSGWRPGLLRQPTLWRSSQPTLMLHLVRLRFGFCDLFLCRGFTSPGLASAFPS